MADEPTTGASGALRPELLKKVRRIEIRSRRLVNSLFLGEYHAVFRGRGIEFSEVREYVPGDEVRSIDWNVTARLNAPFVKKFVEERELTVLLLVDVSASGAFGTVPQTKREVAAEIAALLALSAINNQDRVGLVAFSDRVEKYVAPAKGQRHVLRLVRELLTLEPAGRGTRLATVLDYASTMLSRRAVVFVISDFVDVGDYQTALRVLARRHDLVAIALTDPRELELPDVGIVELEDAESGQTVVVDTSDAKVRAAYRDQADQARRERARLFRQNGVDAIEIGTGSSYIEPLMAFFRARSGAPRRRAAG
ncbi:MAG TPA: DUF58 domain-containing protein [Dehalococcoidia bacterium]|nr:DUF58 domain-containing protein [Dehalococcoidia bacterium]